MKRTPFAQSIAVVACAMLAACGGGGSSSSILPKPGPSASSAPSASYATKIVLTIPGARATAKLSRKAQYISASTQSLVLAVTGTGSTANPSGFPLTANLTPTSPGCTVVSGNTTCTITAYLPPGTFLGSLTLYDALGGMGNVLSSDIGVPFTVAAGQANSIPLTLAGKVASVALGYGTGASLIDGSYTLIGGTGSLIPEAFDADTKQIIGPGAPSFTLTIADTADYTVGTFAAGAYPVTFTGAIPTESTITLTAIPADGSANVVATTGLLSMAPTMYVTDFTDEKVFAYDEQGNAVSPTMFSVNPPSTTAAVGLNYLVPSGVLYVISKTPTIDVRTLTGTAATGYTFAASGTPEAVTFDTVGQTVYIGNRSSGIQAYTYTGAQKALAGTFAASSAAGPIGVYFEPTSSRLYVCNFDGNSISVYNADGTAYANTGTFPNVSNPEDITYDPKTGFLYVINAGPTTGVTVYDLQGNQQTTTGAFAGVNAPGRITYDKYADTIYITNGTTVLAFDGQGNAKALSGAFTNLASPSGITIVP